MDYVWSPWRFQYVSAGPRSGDCFLCELAQADPGRDRENLILCRGSSNFVVLNRFPYTTGHAMIVSFAHIGSLAGLPPETAAEMMRFAQELEKALEICYRPEGFNMGMNLGRAAGAGVADHVHLHVLPRWFGDTNFMTVASETRVLSEDLQTTYTKLASLLNPRQS